MRKAASPKQLTSLLWVRMFQFIIQVLFTLLLSLLLCLLQCCYIHTLSNNLQRNFTRILRVHTMSDLKRMTCIHHLSLYTMLDGYVLASRLLINCVFCFLFYCSSILFTPLVPRVTCTLAFILHGECGVIGMVTLCQVRAEYNLVPRLHCY